MLPKGELHEGHRAGRIRCRAARVRRFRRPVDATTIGSAEASNVDQVGLVCNEYYGRCWRTRGPRYVLRYFYDPSYFPGRGYDYYGWRRLLRSRLRLRWTVVHHSRLVARK
jgi:hypothetical protein